MSFKDKAQMSPVLKRLIKSLETQFHLTYFCFNLLFFQDSTEQTSNCLIETWVQSLNRIFSRDDKQMANKYRKGSQIHQTLKKQKLKAQGGITPNVLADLFSYGCKAIDISSIIGGNEKQCIHYNKQYGTSLQKFKMKLSVPTSKPEFCPWIDVL